MTFIEGLISLRFLLFLLFFVGCVLLFYFSDVFSSQMWIEFDASMPAHLRCSADQVKRTVLAAKADGTIRTYLGETSKTDQLREGSWVPISRTGRKTCPVKALERYFTAAEIGLEEELPLSRAIAAPNSSSKARRQGISYTRARDLVKKDFDGITDTSSIGLHSLRAGGATAAGNVGVPDRLFRRHGRWSSESAKDGYIEDNLNSLLSVS